MLLRDLESSGGINSGPRRPPKLRFRGAVVGSVVGVLVSVGTYFLVDWYDRKRALTSLLEKQRMADRQYDLYRRQQEELNSANVQFRDKVARNIGEQESALRSEIDSLRSNTFNQIEQLVQKQAKLSALIDELQRKVDLVGVNPE